MVHQASRFQTIRVRRAGRDAVGWDVCLDGLVAWLAGRTSEPPAEWLGPMERYIAEFGLGEGNVIEADDGYRVHFARDLVWKPAAQVWNLLTEGADVEIGGEPPARATNGYVPAGSVTLVQAPSVLEYAWRHDGQPAGLVRLEIAHDPMLGTRIELSQTLPSQLAELRATVLAAWHTHLELFFAATQGVIRCPWPKDRIEQLHEHYAKQLGAAT